MESWPDSKAVLRTWTRSAPRDCQKVKKNAIGNPSDPGVLFRGDGGTHICDYCLNHFGRQDLVEKHEESYSKYKAVRTEYSKPGENILRFKNIQNGLESPIKFYFDTESILKPIDQTRGKTKLNQRHVMSAFCLYPVSRIEGFSIEPITYVAKDEHDEVDKV